MGDFRFYEDRFLPDLHPGLRNLDITAAQNLRILPSDLPMNLQELHMPWTYIGRIQDLPMDLRVLDAHHSQVRHLPEILPSTLEVLDVSCTPIAALPPLPRSLQILNVSMTKLTSLPEVLPPNLRILDVSYTRIDELPDIPESVMIVNTDGCDRLWLPFLVSMFPSHHSGLEAEMIRRHVEPINSRRRIHSRTIALKREIAETVFHPRRVEKWIEAGDHVVDRMFGE